MTKRKVSDAFQEEDDAGEPRRTPPRLDESFVASEILSRLPAHAAHAFSAASNFFRRILTDPDYWLSRAPAHAPIPRAACLVVRGSNGGGGGDARLLHEFHYADAAFSAEHAVVRAAGGGGSLAAYRFAGTCNGLVLLAVPWSDRSFATGVVFNPASGEEEAVAVAVGTASPGGGGGGRVFRSFCGFGYSRSSKVYKALLCSACHFLSGFCLVDLIFVLIGGSRRHKPRRVARLIRLDGRNPVPSSLSMDGKVYVLPDIIISTKVLAFDVDAETVTFIEGPPGGWPLPPMSPLMEVWGRPCDATGYPGTTMLWTLTPDHRWELRCSFDAVPSPRRGGIGADDHAMVHGAWDCGEGLLFVVFQDGRGCMYKHGLGAVARQVDGAAADNLLPIELQNVTFCWGYQPTLIPPAKVIADVASPCERGGKRRFSSGTSRPHNKRDNVEPRRCLEALMAEMMRKQPRHLEEPSAST